MSRTLAVSFWSFVSFILCSCAQETEIPTPAPNEVAPVPVAASADDRVPAQEKSELSEEPDWDITSESAPNRNTPPSTAETTPPSSGNPVIDFFRSVDRSVKSTTPETRRPTQDDGEIENSSPEE